MSVLTYQVKRDQKENPSWVSMEYRYRRLTQQQAAAIIGYSKRGWQDIEGGARSMRPSAWELFQLKTKGE
jgi:DNA-binding XRE family transcriptional regulator